MTQSFYDQKPALLQNLLDNAPFMGLSQGTLQMAGRTIGLNDGQIAILATDGIISMIDFWFAQADDFVVSALSQRQSLKIREKATLAVRARLEFLGQNKEALRKALAILAMPQNAARALSIGGRFVDKAWRAFGDKSTDINYYSKRAMLLGVDIATAIFFLGDESEENSETWAFLDRRIENIMQIEKTKFEAKKALAKIPDPIPFLAKLRFGAKPLP